LNQESELSEKLFEAGFTPFESKEIEELTKEELLSRIFFDYMFSINDIFAKQDAIAKAESRANELKIKPQFKEIMKVYKKQEVTQNKLISNLQIKHNEVAEQILNENSIALYENDLYIYKDGVYIKDKKEIDKKTIKIIPEATSYFRNEVYQDLILNATEMKIDKERGVINFKNGLFSLKDKKIYQHTPKFFSINQIQTNLNFEAKKVQAIDDVLNKLSSNKPERKQTILEMIGYSMTTSVKLQKAFILYGETARNGKSTLINIITELIGKENLGRVSFEDMNKNRFASSGIKGKILNIGSEMSEDYILDVSNFKMFITGDDLEIEEKFKPKQIISPYAKFIFNANKLPNVADKTNGFYRRLQIIPLETSFTDKDAKNFDFQKLVSNEALEYLAKIALEAYMSMSEHFSNYKESNEEVSKYKIASNSILNFINDKDYISTFINNGVSTKYASQVYYTYKN